MRILACLALTLLLALPTQAQSNRFRASQAHVSVGTGVFSYYGPLDLGNAASREVTSNDLGLVLTASFPIVADALYFRGLLGLSNFDTSDERAMLATAAQNEFLWNRVLWLEPEVVWTPFQGADRLLPYLYTGFGMQWAAPFDTRAGGRNANAPGPDRTTFMIPVGVGLDIGLSRVLDLYLDASYRFNLNYVLQNDAGYQPHNNSLITAGLRYALPFGRQRGAVFVAESQPLPLIPEYVPPVRPAGDVAGAAIDVTGVYGVTVREEQALLNLQPCPISELNAAYFALGSSTLDTEAQRRLNENVALLNQYPMCRIVIEAFVDAAEVDGAARFATNLDELRAQAVYQFYLERGVNSDQMCAFAMGQAYPGCDKEDPDMGCFRNRIVQTLPKDCTDYYNN